MIYAISVFFTILIYSLLLKLCNIVSFKNPMDVNKRLMDLFKTALPVAIAEEFLFRHLLMAGLFIGVLKIGFVEAAVFSSIIFSGSHFWMGMYRDGTEYNKLDKTFLVFGLFLFSLVLSKLYFIQGANILFHAFSIYAVQINTGMYNNEDEKNWMVFDNGHQILRCPPIWIILICYYIIIK